jgi:hypothetical protein
MPVPSVLTVLLTLTVAGASPGAPQSVEITHVANVGDTTGGPAFLGSLLDLLLLDDGRILISDLRNPGVRLFDPSGAFLRDVGRLGQGPGEYAAASLLLPGHEGGVELFTVGRKITYSRELEELETTRVTTPVISAHMTPVGDYLVRGRPLNSPESIGLPIHVFSRKGEEFVRSFGADPPIRNLRNMPEFSRRFAASSDTTFWSADILRFRLQHWTIGGELLAEVERSPEWFPPQSEVGIDPKDGPRPRIAALSYDPDSEVVWVATLVAREDWQAAPTRAQVRGARGQPLIDDRPDIYAVYRTIIEAIDPRTGDVVAAGSIDERVKDISAGRYAYSESRTSYGEPIARVWRLELRR